MNKLKISTRLAVLLGILSLVIAVNGAIGIISNYKTNASLKTVYEDRTVCIGQISDIQNFLKLNEVAIISSLANKDPKAFTSSVEQINKNLQSIDGIWNAYMATYLTEDEAKLAKQFALDRESLNQNAVKPILKALQEGNAGEVRNLYENSFQPMNPKLNTDIANLMQLQLDVAKDEYSQAEARYDWVIALSGASLTLGLALSVILGGMLIRNIRTSLNIAIKAAQTISGGDLSQTIDTSSRDEIGDLLKSLNTMNTNLRTIATNVRSSADSIMNSTKELSLGNLELSKRTEDQAAFVEQTAATLEQLTATSHNNAQNSLQANELASKSYAAAKDVSALTVQVANAMSEISKSSNQVEAIILTTDEIAFQTNILALNAAVEAARAGEYGKGFGVVANEVGVLAKRSADSAKLIKTLIMESIAKSKNGSELVVKTAKSIDEIAALSKQVMQSVSEISNTSREQSDGIRQINDAITQVDISTQKNAALVEESANASQSTSDQAASLVQAVASLKVN